MAFLVLVWNGLLMKALILGTYLAIYTIECALVPWMSDLDTFQGVSKCDETFTFLDAFARSRRMVLLAAI